MTDKGEIAQKAKAMAGEVASKTKETFNKVATHPKVQNAAKESKKAAEGVFSKLKAFFSKK